MSYKKTVECSAVKIILRKPRTEIYYSSECYIGYSYQVELLTKLTLYPKCLLDLLTVYTPARPLHSSSDLNILNVATTRTKSYGQQTFAFQGPSNWNRVPGEVWRIKDTFAFRRKPTTSLFHQQTKISKLISFHIIVNLYVLIVYFNVVFQLFSVIIPSCIFISLSLVTIC